MKNALKIILAVLLYACLLRMPYGYYEFVRFAAMAGFVLLAYHANKAGHTIEAIIFVCLVILFQPVFKIALGRTIWNVVDVIVGVALIASLLAKPEAE
jgi:hypothetical protein